MMSALGPGNGGGFQRKNGRGEGSWCIPLASPPAAVLGAETAALQGVDFDRWTGAARGARHG